MRRALPAAGALVVVALAALVIAASADHWHVADDFTNLRWVMEHRDAPWRALTERHSVHDHVRPLTLLATWLGAQLSDGAWWGLRAVNLGLLLGGLAGAAALARRLAPADDRRGAAVLAALLVLGLPGFADLPWWNAWMCSAGELCCALWALWAADRALARGRPPLLALCLLVAAGLFKEPGWLVAVPLIGLAARHRRWPWIVATALIAAAGVAFTWHPANVLRAEAVPGALLPRIDQHLDQITALHPAADPARPVRALLLWALLVHAALPTGRWRWALGLGLPALLYAGARWLDGPSLGWAPVALVLVALVRSWRTPSPGLLLLVATWLPAMPYPGTNPVQQLTGAVGLVVYLAAAAGPRLRLVGGLVAAVTVLSVGLRRSPSAMVPDVDATRDRRAALLGLAAISQELDASDLIALSHDSEYPGSKTPDSDWRIALRLAPLWGARLHEGIAPQLRGGTQVDKVLLMAAPRVLADRDLLGDVELPVARTRDDRPRPGRAERSRLEDPSVAVTAEPGRYLLGVLAEDGQTDSGVAAADRCGHSWQPEAPYPGVDAVGTIVELRPGCGPLSVRRTVHPGLQAGRPFLAPLGQATLSLRRAVIDHRLLDVGIGPVHLDPAGGGGPRPPGI